MSHGDPAPELNTDSTGGITPDPTEAEEDVFE